MRRKVDEEHIPNNMPEDALRLHNGEFALQAYFWLDHFGVLPDELLRQDKSIVDDIETLFAAEQQTLREYYMWKKANGR